MTQTVFTIIIPIHNERDALPRFNQDLEALIHNSREKYQIVFVDDGSTDGSAELLTIGQSLRLSSRQGKTAAIKAGIGKAVGEAIIFLDGDGQYDCRDIALFAQAYQKGNAMVCGWRKNRRDPPVKTVPSFFANTLARFLFGVKIHDLGCGLKLYRKDLLNNQPLPNESHRLLPLYILNENPGLRYTEIVVRHFPRISGKTKYGLERILPVFRELIHLKRQWKK